MLGKVYKRHPKSLCIYYLYLINIISICNIYVEKAMYMFGERKGNMINPLTKGICLCNLTPDTPLEI